MTDYSNILYLVIYSNREGKRSQGNCFIQIIELFVHVRTSLLEASVWDDYQEWLKWKGTDLLALSSGESHLKQCTGNMDLDLKQRGWQMALRMEKLLADGMDYLSNKDILATNAKSWKERRRQLSQCCQLVYRKRFGRMETDKKKRYSIVN